MVSCPNCSTPMAHKAFESAVGMPVSVSTCAGCSLLWFDRGPSSRLGPGGVLELFKSIGAGVERVELRPSFQCPTCTSALNFTHDVQHTTRFTYWRCPTDHGQLISYTQFLLEKNFVRPPSAQELANLRASVREISCSHCGAPINLATDSACAYCHSPIALIDPDSVARAVREMSLTDQGQQEQAASSVTRSTVHDAQMQAIFSQTRIDQSGGQHDLLGIGIAAIAQLLHRVR